jgi:hypothetical protein
MKRSEHFVAFGIVLFLIGLISIPYIYPLSLPIGMLGAFIAGWNWKR